MSTSTLGTRPLAITPRGVGGVIAALVIGMAILAVAFHAEMEAAVRVWNASTAYSHCYFIIPIAAYLAWDRRHVIAATPIVPLPSAVLLAVPLAAAWLLAERLGIMEGRQLVAIALALVLCLAVLGRRMWWAMSVPLLYLFFLVPFGAFVTEALQHFTARFSAIGLDILGIPNYADDTIIEIPEGTFFVAEACAGLRFLIASIAFGVLYACLLYRSAARRLIFVGVSIVVPIIANGFRALGIVVLGHILGSAEAVEADHIIYGWLFFSFVIMLLILAGLPFRQDDVVATTPRADLRPALPVPPALRLAAVALVLGVLAWIGPAAAMALDRAGRDAPLAVRARFTTPAGCTAANDDAVSTLEVAGVPAVATGFTCGTTAIVATEVTLPPRANPALIARVERRLTREDTADDARGRPLTIPSITPANWRVTETTDPSQVTAAALWLDGAPAPGGIRSRVRQAINSVLGAATAPVLVTVSVAIPGKTMNPELLKAGDEAIAHFLAVQTTLDEQVRTMSALPHS